MNLPKYGEDKNVIDGLNNNLIKILQEDDSYVVWTRKKYWLEQRREDVLQWNTTSRNIIKIVPGTEFDLMISQIQIKRGKITYPKRRYYLASTRTRHPLKKGTKLDKAFVFQLPKLLFKLNQLVQGLQHRFLEKGAIQQTSLLMNLTTRLCGNMAILLERHIEYHEPSICHSVRGGIYSSRQDNVVLRALAQT
jgi:hypothetical protein